MGFLKIENVSKSYSGQQPSLQKFSLEVEKGQILSIIGESGAGKSTLLKIIAGLESQDEGSVSLDGEKVLNPSEKLVPGYDELQLVHQDNKLYPNSTIEENIRRPLLLYEKVYSKGRVEHLLDLFGLQEKRSHYPRELSGGQQQKTAIARALSLEPKVLLMDEPFSNLDNLQKRVLMDELREIFEHLKVTVIWVTHDVYDALTISEVIGIMKRGELIQYGNASNIYQKPISRYVAELFSYLNPLPDKENHFIRPADIQPYSEGYGIQAEVLHCLYLLSYYQLTIKLKDSGLIWKLEHREKKFEIGEKISLTFDEKKILKF